MNRTLSAITSCFAFSQGTTDLVLTRAARTGDQRYLARNVMLNPERAADFFRSDSQSFEYLSPGVTDDALFDQEGAILLRPAKVIELAFPRGPEKVNHKEIFDWPQ